MRYFRLIVLLILFFFVGYYGCLKNSVEWDNSIYTYPNIPIRDSSICSAGFDLAGPNNKDVDSIKIDIRFTHDDPTNLVIKLVTREDTFLVFDHGSASNISITTDHFKGLLVCGYWLLLVFDEVKDGKQGTLDYYGLSIKHK